MINSNQNFFNGLYWIKLHFVIIEDIGSRYIKDINVIHRKVVDCWNRTFYRGHPRYFSYLENIKRNHGIWVFYFYLFFGVERLRLKFLYDTKRSLLYNAFFFFLFPPPFFFFDGNPFSSNASMGAETFTRIPFLYIFLSSFLSLKWNVKKLERSSRLYFSEENCTKFLTYTLFFLYFQKNHCQGSRMII